MGNLQFTGCEIPDSSNSTFNHLMEYILSRTLTDGDNTMPNLPSTAKTFKSAHRKNFSFSSKMYRLFITIKGRFNCHTVVFLFNHNQAEALPSLYIRHYNTPNFNNQSLYVLLIKALPSVSYHQSTLIYNNHINSAMLYVTISLIMRIKEGR